MHLAHWVSLCTYVEPYATRERMKGGHADQTNTDSVVGEAGGLRPFYYRARAWCSPSVPSPSRLCPPPCGAECVGTRPLGWVQASRVAAVPGRHTTLWPRMTLTHQCTQRFRTLWRGALAACTSVWRCGHVRQACVDRVAKRWPSAATLPTTRSTFLSPMSPTSTCRRTSATQR
jgi:hypothetical protein